MQKVNCIACGGDAHGTSGWYQRAGCKPVPCGFCNRTGKVDPRDQFLNWDEPRAKGAPVYFKNPDRFNIFFDAFIVLLFASGAVFWILAVHK